MAFGGTLHQHVHELPGMLDHRKHRVPEVDGQYAPSHAVTLADGGFLHGLVGRRTFEVNSLHSQGIDRPGARLEVEARAPDGLIEAVTVKACASFALAIQWHPGVACIDGSGRARHLRGVRGCVPRAFREACRHRRDGADSERLTERRSPRGGRKGGPSRRAARGMSCIEHWCKEHAVTEVEALMPDMSGVARGKIVPVGAYCRTLG